MSEQSGQPPQQPPDEPGYGEQQATGGAGQVPPPPPSAPPPYPAAGGPSPYGGYTPPPPGWAPQPGVPYPVYVLPDHPKATSSLVVGLIAVAGMFVCALPILASPVAWVLGAQARREIRNAPQQWGGEGKATAGMVLGIIGTVLLVLGLIALAVVIVLIAVSDSSTFEYDTGV